MVKIFPFIFVILWSSAFITTKPLIDNSDPFSALAFRFFFVAIGFYLFSLYSKQTIDINRKNLIESLLSEVLFHGFHFSPYRISEENDSLIESSMALHNPRHWLPLLKISILFL